jgi:hypothetical protein
MDGNAPRHGSARGWAVALALAVLVGAVAVASTGSVPGGDGGSRRPSEQLLDTAVSLFVVLLGVGAVVTVATLAYLRKVEASSSDARPARRGVAGAFAGIATALALVLAALAVARSRDDGQGQGGGLLPGLGGGDGDPEAARPAYDPEFTVWPVAAIVILALAAATAVLLERRARLGGLPRPETTEQEEALADVLDETLDDLRAEPDPRRAVLLAYARMERALRAVGLARRPAEAPDEYLERIVASLELSARTAGRLTSLFTWARFSGHDVDPAMKEQAIDTLEAARDELRAAAARREAEALEALEALRPREAGS